MSADLFEDCLTIEELAHALDLAPATLNQWRSQGKGPPYIKVGGRIRYRRHAVREWLDTKERHPGRHPVSPARVNGGARR